MKWRRFSPTSAAILALAPTAFGDGPVPVVTDGRTHMDFPAYPAGFSSYRGLGFQGSCCERTAPEAVTAWKGYTPDQCCFPKWNLFSGCGLKLGCFTGSHGCCAGRLWLRSLWRSRGQHVADFVLLGAALLSAAIVPPTRQGLAAWAGLRVRPVRNVGRIQWPRGIFRGEGRHSGARGAHAGAHFAERRSARVVPPPPTTETKRSRDVTDPTNRPAGGEKSATRPFFLLSF